MCTETAIYPTDKIVRTFETPEVSKECSVCGEKKYLEDNYTACPSQHKICKTCYLSVLQMCYCKNSLGEIVYKCPLCRNEYRIDNKQMNIVLNLLEIDDICVKVHKICEHRNITKKCQFEMCGCRTNIVDIISEDELDLTIKDIIYVADKYSKPNSSLNRKLQKRVSMEIGKS